MKFRSLIRFAFVLFITAVFLFAVFALDKFWFVNYDFPQFAIGFFSCFISGIARGWFNQKFPRTDGQKDFSYDTFLNKKA